MKKGCHCPATARRIPTNGQGRGFVCQSKTAKRGKFRPFVKAVGCS